MSLTNVGKFKAIIQIFFFSPVERLEEGDFDFSLIFLHYMNYLSRKLIFLK